jgi:hypothetical protein
MKEDAEKERIEQIEQEEMERQKRASLRRKSSPILRQHQHEKDDSVHQPTTMSEPIPRHTPFVSVWSYLAVLFSIFSYFLLYISY